MRRKLGNGLVVLGLLLIVGALIITAFNLQESIAAGNRAAAILERLQQADALAERTTDPAEQSYAVGKHVYPKMEMLKLDGENYIGILSVPALRIELPVMDEWDYGRLKIAPCRYSGSYYRNDLVICGHNYATHFSPLKGVEAGTDVYFRTVDGQRIHYTVLERETVDPADVEEMLDNSDGWDLTLFTCNNGGFDRCAVRCARVDGD